MDSPALIDHLRAHSNPLEPIPTGDAVQVGLKPGIRAVVFDIYGTLFISGSGDISLAKNEDRSNSLTAALETAGFSVRDPEAPWSEAFMSTLEAFREERGRAGIRYPEVRIEEVWKRFTAEAVEKGWLAGTGSVELAIVDHECRVNPCWPMPGLSIILARIGLAGLHLGIVSNAQFYTPLLFPALLDAELETCGFNPDFCVWSYVEREGKPSTGLYLKLRERLEAARIAAEEVLYIGNDLRNDIWPAAAAGFHTCLFAGDQRSLRWRKDDPDCQSVQPDYIITDLLQLSAILG
jgi:putative hydrolase of the HAD superfamily